MSPPVLTVENLTRRFADRDAVHGVSFTLAAGERLAVIGPNGAGKTTLLSMLAGSLAPSAGDLVRDAGTRVGWVPQQPALYTKLSATENLILFARLEGLPDPAAAVDAMLEVSGLRERADEPAARLSGGNQQRLNIAIGLLCRPAVLLLDEPSSSLDPRQRIRLWEFVSRLAEAGTSVVYSTHNVHEAERYGDRVLVLVDGEAIFLGTPDELASAVVPRGPDVAHDFEAAFVAFLTERGH